MHELILPLALQGVGILVILAEIFIPSLGMLSLLAAGVMGYSLYLAFTTLPSQTAWLFVWGDLILVPALIYFGIRVLAASSLSLHKQLSKTDGVVSQASDLEHWVGKNGHALSDLRPSGLADIDGHRLDVVTDGSYIEKDAPIRVVRVTGNQILVISINEENHP